MFDKLKSTEADFSFSSIESQYMILNKNILYITHIVDKCLVLLKEMKTNDDLQMQVDDFFQKGEAHPEPASEDSKQEEVVEDAVTSSSN